LGAIDAAGAREVSAVGIRVGWGEEEAAKSQVVVGRRGDGGDDFIEGERRALIGGGAGAADRYLLAAPAVDAS